MTAGTFRPQPIPLQARLHSMIVEHLVNDPPSLYERPPDDYEAWLQQKFPQAMYAPLAPRHHRVWAWLRDLRRGVKAPAIIECVPRGGGKSTTVETGCVYVGMRQTRRFVLYVSATQAQADAHVQSIAGKLEALGVDRALNKYQQSRGWTQQLLRAANGFNVMSLGLDAAARGIKLDDYRPDCIVLDDVDARHDTPAAVAKKIATITESILPSGSTDAAVVFVQNKIHDNSVMAQTLDGRADFLQQRMPPTEEPALTNFSYTTEAQPDGTVRYVLSGEPTWLGQDLDVCTAQANEWGITAFRREAQHETDVREDGLWNRATDIDPFRVSRDTVPQLVRIVVGVDPPGGATECGIVVGGVDTRGHVYILADVSLQAPPDVWGAEVVTAYEYWEANAIVDETNFGGDMVRAVVRAAAKDLGVLVSFKDVRATRGKLLRAEPAQALSAQGKVHHVGVFSQLEKEQTTWRPGVNMGSPNRLDAYTWVVTDLALTPKRSQPPAPPTISQRGL